MGIAYATIEETNVVGNLPSSESVLRRLIQDEFPIDQILARANRMKINDTNLARIMSEETGITVSEHVCDIQYARHCAKQGRSCPL